MRGESPEFRYLRILSTLQEGPSSMKDLAARLEIPRGLLDAPLGLLSQQGLVQSTGDTYSLAPDPLVPHMLSTMGAWRTHTDNTFYEIAKDVAKATLERSWAQRVAVRDVMLFGSTARRQSVPKDIDMLILHSGGILAEFDPDPYDRRPAAIAESDQPVDKTNRRVWAPGIFHMLGYREPVQDQIDEDGYRAFALERRLRDEESAYAHIAARVKDLLPDEKPEAALAKLFDVHVLSTGIFSADQTLRDSWALQGRAAAVRLCRDQTFWQTILAEGRIYDPAVHDFTLSFEDRYPGVLALFDPAPLADVPVPPNRPRSSFYVDDDRPSPFFDE